MTEKCTIDTTGTIDLASYKLTTKVKAAADTGLYITGDVTVKGTTGSIERVISYVYDEKTKEFTNEESEEACAVVVIGTSTKAAKFTLESGVISGTSKLGYGIYASEYSDVTIKNGTVVGNAAAISGNNTTKPVDIKIYGGTITSNGTVAVYFPAAGDLTVTGGTFNGVGGFDIREGTASIANATINLTVAGSNATRDDYGMPFNIGVGVYGLDGASYGNPSVTLQNITVRTSSGVSKICDVYYGVLKDINKGSNTSFNEMTVGYKSSNLVKNAISLTVADAAGAELITLRNPTGNGTAAMIDLVSNGVKVLKDSRLNCTVASDDNNMVIAGVQAGASGITFSRGSIATSGDVIVDDADGTITVTGEATLTENFKVGAGMKLILSTGASLAVPEGTKLTIDKGAELELQGTATMAIAPKASLVVGGAVAFASNATGSITNDGTIVVTDPTASIPETIGGTGSVDTSGAASEGTISGSFDTDTTFTQNQVITAVGDVTLVKGAVFIIKGTLIIPEGINFTVEAGAELIIANSTGKLENNGNLVIESSGRFFADGVTMMNNGGLRITNNATVENNGTIDLAIENVSGATANWWAMYIQDGKFVNNGTFTVGEDSTLLIGAQDGASVGTLENKGDMTLSGEIYVADSTKGIILNAGTMTLNGEGYTDFTIYQTSVDGIVDVVKFTNMDNANPVVVTVSDEKLETKGITYIGGTSTVSIAIGAKDIASGVKIALQTTAQLNDDGKVVVVNGLKQYCSELLVSGAVAAETTEDVIETTVVEVIITVSGDNAVIDDLALGEDVTLAINGALEVSGNVTVVKDSAIGFGANGASITVTGKVTITEGDIVTPAGITDTKINAAKYDVAKTTTTDKLTIYTAFETAVADGAKKVYIFGAVDVENDVTVPSGVTVTVNTGATLSIDKDATVKFVSGAILKNSGTVDVDGVLSFEDKKSGLKPEGNIIRDVTIEGETSRTYTNLAYALSIAKEGETVKLTGPVDVKNDITIPAGVTLDTAEQNVTVYENVTVTVDGTLFINGGSFTMRDATAGSTDKDAKIVLNGTVKSDNVISDDYEISGAYYAITVKTDKTYYVQPVETAAPNVATYDVDDGVSMTIVNYDAENALKIGDITLTGKDADNIALVAINGNVIAKSITLDNAAVRSTAVFNGVITNGVGTVNANVKAMVSSAFTVTSMMVDDVKTLVIGGDIVDLTDDDAKYNLTVAGEVTVDTANIYAMTVDGKLTVEGLNVTISKLSINGGVVVNGDSKLMSDDIEVFGTLAGAERTSDAQAGIIDVTNMYVGISKKTVTGTALLGAAASVTTGDYEIDGLVYVADGSTVSNDVIGDEKPTLFVVEGKNYMTVYDFTGSKLISDVRYKVENAKANGWVDENGKSITGKKIGDVDKVIAKIDYNVYSVVIMANAGVENVSIDGNLLPYYRGILFDTAPVGYQAPNLTAGKHTVTYTLANGYSGTAKLEVNGSVPEGMECTLNGMEFNISGDFEGLTLTLQLTGIEKSGYVPDSPDTNNGMTITDYLLIVLVVLIVVMAIIVAMRMMRS